jgi:hypothetical protein
MHACLRYQVLWSKSIAHHATISVTALLEADLAKESNNSHFEVK